MSSKVLEPAEASLWQIETPQRGSAGILCFLQKTRVREAASVLEEGKAQKLQTLVPCWFMMGKLHL